MESKINNYLETVNQHLKHLTISEKTDIISEIKSHIQEMQINQKVEIDVILEAMGDPKQLAKAYTGETIANITNYNFRNLIRVISFYGKTGFSGMFIVPCVSILSVSLYLCSFLSIMAGVIKTGGTLLGFNVPFIMFDFGFWTVPGVLALPVSIPFAILFYYLSKKLWKLLKTYLATVSKNYRVIKEEIK